MKLLHYKEVLKELSKEHPDQCHLLLGNGFNNFLGVGTSYPEIFKRMMEKAPAYRKIESVLEKEQCNIEWLIKELKNIIIKDEMEIAHFFEAYTERKIKYDFMLSASEIVREKTKDIYPEKNDRIYLLFQRFSTYFTLNYDPFLYLLLMKFREKKLETNSIIGFQYYPLFPTEELDQEQNNIYTEIKELREGGSKIFVLNDSPLMRSRFNAEKKTTFVRDIKEYAKSKNKKWPAKSIEKVVNKILDDERKGRHLKNVRDGFWLDKFAEREEHEKRQNIFFLHGAFHIYENKKCIYKITQTQNKALYERLAEVIDSEEKDIVCILTGTSEEKKQQIEENIYLKKSHEKLSNLQGSIVIFGSSLAENDKHIFSAINSSEINHIYISSSNSKEAQEENSERANALFPNKNVALFDHTTVFDDLDNGEAEKEN